MEARGQLPGNGSLLLPWGSGDRTQVVRLSSKPLYHLSHLTSPLGKTVTGHYSGQELAPKFLRCPQKENMADLQILVPYNPRIIASLSSRWL